MNNNASIQAKGGAARAAAMSPEERSESASIAALSKRSKAVKASHVGHFFIGDIQIDCAVLVDGTRVLSRASFVKAIGRTGKVKGGENYAPESKLPVFLGAENLKPFTDKHLNDNSNPILFELPESTSKSIGYRADFLPSVCNIFLDAQESRVLKENQKHIAARCYVLVRALASVGIIALVDEATGFQYERPRRDLEEQLKKFLSEELRRWVRTFPAEYFKELCRLRGVELRADMKLPSYFGTLTNKLVYKRIAPGLLKKLKERREEIGSPSNKLFSWLSEDVGLRALLVHLGTVIALMKINTDYDSFERQLNKIAQIYPEMPGLFDNPKDWEKPKN